MGAMMDANGIARMFWERQGRQPETRLSRKQALWLIDQWRREGGQGMRADGYLAPGGEHDRASLLYWQLAMSHNGSGRLVTRPLVREA